MERILVTGGTGYIGSHAIIELLEKKYEVDILDNFSNSNKMVLDRIEKISGKKPNFYKIDLKNGADVETLFASNHYSLVMHFAGLKAVGESVKKPLDYYENNVGGTINLLKAMKSHGVEKIIFSSSATVYGEQKTPKLTEDMQTGLKITSPYGETKYMIEEILKDVSCADPNFSVTILRYFNPIGNHSSGLLGEEPNGIPNNLMPIIMKVSTGEIPELKIYGNNYDTPDGTGIRDYIHVVDLAKGHVAAMEKMKKGVEIFNLGSGKGVSVLEIISSFEKISGKKLSYKIAPRRPGDLAEFYADPSKAEKELNWKTELTVEDAMRDTLLYLEKRKTNVALF